MVTADLDRTHAEQPTDHLVAWCYRVGVERKLIARSVEFLPCRIVAYSELHLDLLLLIGSRDWHVLGVGDNPGGVQ